MPHKLRGHQKMAEGDGNEKASGSATAVFISYASQDAPIANSIVEYLEQHGLRCWLAPRDVKPGTQYADAIVGAINETRALVLLLSQNAVASSHVGREVERAASKRKPIIAFRIDVATLSRALEYFLSESQWIDVPAIGMRAALAKLADAVGQRSGQTVAAQPEVSGRTFFQTGRRSKLIAGVAALSVCAAAVLGMRFWSQNHKAVPPRAAAAITDKSIAVLPFVDLSEKHDQEYFADGMAEETIDLLTNIPALKVIGRTSSFHYKGSNQDLRAVGSALGVRYVVEGSVRKSAERLRVTAQLINTDDGSHVWSDTYDMQAGDALRIQDQVATNLVRALQVTLGADYQSERRGFKSAEAYDLFLRGRHAYDREDKDGFESAAAYFQQVLDLDPRCAPAAAWLAMAQTQNAEAGFIEVNEGYRLARESAQRAQSLDPRSAKPRLTLSVIHLTYDWDWGAAEREAREATRLAPRDSLAIGSLGNIHAVLGQWDEAARQYKTALTLDPFNADWHSQLGGVHLAVGRLRDAEAEFRKVLQISPTIAEGHFNLGIALLLQGNYEVALTEIQNEQAEESSRYVGLAMVYHALGQRAQSDAALTHAVQEHGQDAAYEIAETYAYRGESDQAFSWLDRAYRQKDTELSGFKGDPFFKNFAGDPRYKAFLRKMNLPE